MEFRLVVEIDLVVSPVSFADSGPLGVDGATNLWRILEYPCRTDGGWFSVICPIGVVYIATLILSVARVGIVIRILVVALILTVAAQTRIVILTLAATALTGIVILALTAAAHARVVAVGA